MDKVAEFWGSVPQVAQWALAAAGAVYVAKGVGAYLLMLLNVFILSGTDVSCSI